VNSRFTMAAHVLAMLAHAAAERRGPVTSEKMAASIQTNPVVVRRLVAELARAGLVVSKRGTCGGVTLAKSPKQITLQDVYAAVEKKTVLFGRHPSGPSPECAIGPHVAAYLEGVFDRARAALAQSLEEATIEDMFQDLLLRVQRSQRRRRKAT
jgi:Rrf2 family protein